MPTALLNSRLASASAVARSTLRKAAATSFSPETKAMPVARKPATGISAIATIRARTVSVETNRFGLIRRGIGSDMARFGDRHQEMKSRRVGPNRQPARVVSWSGKREMVNIAATVA